MKQNDFSFSKIGFGAWQLGNKALFDEMSVKEGIELVKNATERGVRFFDTAPGYANGLSETILGLALQDIRDEVFINSKFGHRADGTSNFEASMMESAVKESLKRLNTSYLDSLILHNPSFEILQGKTDHFQEMKRLKSLGLIHHYGVSIDTFNELETVLTNTDVEVVELLFNVFSQACIPLFDEIKRRKILLIIKVPLDSGWLTGKYHENTVFKGIRSRWSGEDIQRRNYLTNRLKTLLNDHDLTKYALSFILSFDAVSVVIPGTRTLNQLEINLNSLSYIMPEEIKKALMQFYQDEIKNNPLPW